MPYAGAERASEERTAGGVGRVGQSQGVPTLANLRKEWVVSVSESH